MKRVVLAAVVGGLLWFLFGFFFFGVLPTDRVFKTPTNPETLSQALQDHLPETGVYAVPLPELRRVDAHQFDEKFLAGPVAMIFAYPKGKPLMPPSALLLGLAQFMVTSFLMALLLSRATPVLHDYAARARFLFTSVLIVVFLSDISPSIWWHHPWDFHLIMDVVFHLIGGLLVSLAIAKLVPGPNAAT